MSFRFAEVDGYRVVDEEGKELGTVHDVRVRRRSGSAQDRADQQWRVAGVVVGERGLRERLGVVEARHPSSKLAHDLVPWSEVTEIDGSEKVIRVKAGTEPG
jgi:sporulation protein YlmC with PRC-barrel domain